MTNNLSFQEHARFAIVYVHKQLLHKLNHYYLEINLTNENIPSASFAALPWARNY